MRWTVGRVVLAGASLGGATLFARTLFFDPPSPWMAAAALGGYAAIAVAGAMVPGLEMYGDVLCELERGKGRVCLTFDDGPHEETTRRVLDLLDSEGVRATFFVVGQKAERCPELVSRMAQAGHDVGVHGYRHDRLYAFKSPARVREDVDRACRAVEAITGRRPTFFRPPLGHVSPRVVEGTRRAGLVLVGWSVRGLDGMAGTSSRTVLARVGRGIRDGAIVLLHDAAERDDRVPSSLEALPDILRLIRARNLSPLTLRDARPSAV
jgi:peptidoglycan-N-acetylglucosamine deacetylase